MTATTHVGQIDPATIRDTAVVERIVEKAYSKYVERLGMLPAAMKADYRSLAASGDLYVLRLRHVVVGAVLLQVKEGAIWLSNLVIDPSFQGKGYGKRLMIFAEDLARRKNVPVVELFTNELMHENIELYLRAGYVETGRKTEDGFKRVFFQKTVS